MAKSQLNHHIVRSRARWGRGRPPSQSLDMGDPERGPTPPSELVINKGPGPSPRSNISRTNSGGPPTRSQAFGHSSVPAPRRGTAPLTQPGVLAPHSPSTIPAVSPVTSKDIVSNTPPPCHPNVHRRLPRLGRCIRTSGTGRPGESQERRGAIGYRRIRNVGGHHCCRHL